MTSESAIEGFDRFWSAYPKKRDKGEARKAWIQTAKIRPPIDVLLEAVERGKSSLDWHKTDRGGIVGAFIPYPASYLRAEGWDNEYEVMLAPICTGRRAPDPVPIVVPPPSEEQKANVRAMLSAVKRAA